MRVRWRVALGVLVAGLVAGGPALYSAHRSVELRNFRVVEEGVLYRSGQLTPAGLDRVLRDYRIRTVVTLRTVRNGPGESKPYPDDWEREVCAARGARHVRIVPLVWGPAGEDGVPPAQGMVDDFLRVMDDRANYPVLVHCFAGVHRTGHMCALFRMTYHGWGPDAAIAEMHGCGYDPDELHPHVETYLRRFDPAARRPARR